MTTNSFSPQASELFRSYPAAEVYVGNLAQDPGNGSGLSLLKVPHATSGIERYGIPRPIVSAREILRGSDAVVIAEGTSCFPSLRWLYGLSPFNLDGRGVSNVINSMQGGNSKRLIYLSCIGAERELSRGIPKLDANILFWVLNFFGALDAKHGGEDLIRSAQTTLGVETCIVRPKLHCYESGPFGGIFGGHGRLCVRMMGCNSAVARDEHAVEGGPMLAKRAGHDQQIERCS